MDKKTNRIEAFSNRRGAMEKRRRDKINNSLIELKSLVPTAKARETSEKLEKAQILKLTVDYLKSTREGRVDSSSTSMDFREMGFRECILDISDYLVNVEGLDYNDPFRLRLISHLKCFSPTPNSINDLMLLAFASYFTCQNKD